MVTQKDLDLYLFATTAQANTLELTRERPPEEVDRMLSLRLRGEHPSLAIPVVPPAGQARGPPPTASTL